jgi:hypothetical protein
MVEVADLSQLWFSWGVSVIVSVHSCPAGPFMTPWKLGMFMAGKLIEETNDIIITFQTR